MEKTFDKFFRRCEIFLAEPNNDTKQTTHHDCILTGTRVKRILFFLAAVFFIAAIVDVAVIFSVPEEWTRASWFWLKETISIGVAYLICKLFKPFCRHLA